MVHALQEVWRVLKQDGILIDLRPIAVDTPLLIKSHAGWQSAGRPDQSPDRIYDHQANQAMRAAVGDRLFIKLKQGYFDICYYWDELEDFKADIDTRWEDEILVADKIWKKARALFKQGNGPRRVRFPFRKKITIYLKAPSG